MLNGPQPYKLPQVNMPNRKKYEQFEGCVFKYDD